jgi:hypothetical protein
MDILIERVKKSALFNQGFGVPKALTGVCWGERTRDILAGPFLALILCLSTHEIFDCLFCYFLPLMAQHVTFHKCMPLRMTLFFQYYWGSFPQDFWNFPKGFHLALLQIKLTPPSSGLSCSVRAVATLQGRTYLCWNCACVWANPA